MMIQPVVALVRTSPGTVIADYNRLLGLILPPPIPNAEALLIAAIERQFPFPAQSTPPWQLDGIARALRSQAYGQLHLHLTHPDPFDRHALQPIAHDLALEQISAIERVSTMAVFMSTLRRGPGVAYRGSTRLALAYARHRATLAVIDGTTVGNGPLHQASQPEIGNILIASRDPVAADAVAVTLLGLNPFVDVAHLRVAHDCGIGTADLEQIQLLGDVDLARLRWPAHPPPQRRALPSIASIVQQISMALQPFGKGRQQASDDFTSWTAVDRERYTSWLYDTEWGQLFARYQRQAGPATFAETSIQASEASLFTRV